MMTIINSTSCLYENQQFTFYNLGMPTVSNKDDVMPKAEQEHSF